MDKVHLINKVHIMISRAKALLVIITGAAGLWQAHTSLVTHDEHTVELVLLYFSHSLPFQEKKNFFHLKF